MVRAGEESGSGSEGASVSRVQGMGACKPPLGLHLWPSVPEESRVRAGLEATPAPVPNPALLSEHLSTPQPL